MSEDDLVLFAGPDLPVRRGANGRSCVVGHLFERGGSSALAQLDIELSPDRAKNMLQRFWGSYVALSWDNRRLRVMRDPSGGLACYHAHIDGRHYFTSLPHLLIDSVLAAAAIEWPEIARSLTQHSERLAQTAIRGIEELLPGTALDVTGLKPERRSVWNAWDHAVSSPPADPSEALREALCSTLEAWGQTLRRPLIEISGGLDSAVVAAGLSRTSSGASLITFAPAPGDPDETLYAKAIADHLGLDLTVVKPRVDDVDLSRSMSRDLPRPNARAFTQAADALSLQHGRAIGADAFVSGGGGDDVFCYLRTILPAVDRLRTEGVGATLSSAMDIAAMNHSTFWEASYRIVRRLIRRRPGKSPADLRFLSRDAWDHQAPAKDELGRKRLPGKAEHVRSVLSIHNYLEGHARASFAPILSPLLSQPIVECCLSIPAWHWCEGGSNRAVARRAFRERLPRTVLERRSKGHFDGFCSALLDANQELVRSMLLDGRLAGQGLLDRNAVDGALSNPFPPAETVTRLLALIDVESWAASWLARPAHRR
nr:hypothetical protein [Sphingomonas sp.]